MLEEAILFLILYTLLVFTDLVPVYKEKNRKAIIFSTGIFMIAFTLQFLIIFNVKLPRYADIIENIMERITGYLGEK